MKQTVTESDFVQAFADYSRDNNFSIEGRRALFAYLTEIEEGAGEELELDVIAICCDFAEYSTAIEAAIEYGLDLEGDTEEEREENALEQLRDKTTVIEVDGGSVIVQGF